jgi:hypothetical protein
MRRTLYSSLAAISCLGLLGGPGAAPAQAAAPARCIIVLEEAAPGTATLTAVERCGDAQYLAAQTTDRYQLMTWYAEADYRGWGEAIYGKLGPCDRDGYRLDTNNGLGYWNRNLSSYRVYDPCWFSAMTNNQGETTDRAGDVSFVGAQFNDNVAAIRVWSR